MGSNVIVIGMHRSGTSAVTNALRLLGFSLGVSNDLFAPRPPNPEGNWEHRRLTFCNNRILESQGGSWDAPPALPEGWERSPAAGELLSRLRDEFTRAYPRPGWVWKDPRTCLTLPLWLRVWPDRPAAVTVFRHPVAVARSLHARDGIPLERGLALWERYNSEALRNAGPLAGLTRDYDAALADPLGFAEGLRDGLASLGAAAPATAAAGAAALKPELRRNTAGAPELSLLSDSQRRLLERLRAASEAPPRCPAPA